MTTIKITLFKDKALDIDYGALIESDTGETFVAQSIYRTDLAYKIRMAIDKIFEEHENNIFEKLQ